MTTCVISQPRFFPGLHYLHRMMVADVFVILDTVQYTPRHEENRAKLKTPNGAQWLTVPVRRQSREQLISETYLAEDAGWAEKAEKTLRTLYAKAPHYAAHAEAVHEILHAPHARLLDLDTASWQPALAALGVECRFVLASELAVDGQAGELLLKLCRAVGADRYLSGAFGRDYLDAEHFAKHGVRIVYHHYDYPFYTQRFGEFLPYLSYLDMLFNVGLDRKAVLSGGHVLAE